MNESTLPAMDENQALVTSIGEYLQSAFSREDLVHEGILALNPAEMDVHAWVVLSDNSDETQLHALKVFSEVEDMFYDEAVMSLHFMPSLDAVEAQLPIASAYSKVAA